VANLEAVDREIIADWIETSVLARGSSINHGSLIQFALEELGIEEARVTHAFQVLKIRLANLGNAYPFVVTPISVAPRDGAENYVYSFLLLVSPGNPVRQLIAAKPSGEMVRSFELVVVEAMKSLLGENSQALCFGWPSTIGRPKEFPTAITWLAGLMRIQPGSAYRSPRRKDGGVDVVAWRPFPDGKSGFPVVLVQCTLQTDFVDKSLDVDTRIWSTWLTLDADPTTVLAIPGTITRKVDWDEIAIRCLILDRIRIAGLLNDFDLKSIEGGSELVVKSLDSLRPLLVSSQE
jgi:hypothetical protein